MPQYVSVNERGQRINASHPQAKLSDAEVDAVRSLREDFGFSYNQILDWFPISKSGIAAICRYERRAQTPARWRRAA